MSQSPQLSVMRPSADEHSAPAEGAADAVQTVMQFLRVVYYRKSYVVTCVVVASLLGGLYYYTATRIYEATASLLITQTGSDILNTAMQTGAQQDALIPTYERLFSSAVVLNGAIERLLKLPAEARIDLAALPRESWVDALRENLSASGLRRTNIIELRYRSKAPQAAEAVVDAIVASYLDFMEKNHRDVSVEIVSILQKERAAKERELKAKQQEMLTLQRVVGQLGVEKSTTVVHPMVQRVITLSNALVDVQQDRMQLEASLEAIRAAIRNGSDLRQHLIDAEPLVGRQLVMSALGLSPEAAELMNSVERQLLADRARFDTFKSHYGPQHPEIQQLVRNMNNAEQHLREYQANVRRRMENVQNEQMAAMLVSMVEERLSKIWELESSLQTEYRDAEASAIQMNDRHAELEIVKNDVQRLSKMHDTLLDRIANVGLNTERDDIRVSMVNEPKAEERPVSPRLALTGLLSLVGGLCVGCATVYLMDLLDDRFRSPDELRDQLRAPVLAMVRKLAVSGNEGASSLQVHVSAGSVESESFRTLRTTLAFSGQDLQRLAITSSEPGDGKTTVLANLATAYAQAGKRTLLVDCDLRRPGLTKLFQLRGILGVSDILRGDADVAEMCQERIQETGVDGLDVLACGPKPPNPVELLSGPRFVDLIAWAEMHYDQILIDCPPVMAASDAAVVGRLVDGIMLVVQPAKNHRRVVLRAADHLVSMGVNLIGLVANQIDDEASGYYGGYGYGYGYGYGDGYGVEDEDEADSLPVEADSVRPRRAA